MNPSDAGFHDNVVVNTVIKEIAQYHPIDSASQKSFKGTHSDYCSLLYRCLCVCLLPVVVLSEVDRLSKGAQHALRRTMEKYSSSCRIILCCNSPSKVIEPVRSRCLGIRIPAPSEEQVKKTDLQISGSSHHLYHRFVRYCKESHAKSI